MISIPIINAKSTIKTRPDYLAELRKAKAGRVLLYTSREYAADEQRYRGDMRLLAENISYYESKGLEVGVWIDGFGHGVVLAHEEKANYPKHFTKIRGLMSGEECDDSFCPTDSRYVEAYSDFVCQVVNAGAKMIMIDDDLRFAWRGVALVGCACENHIRLFNERMKETGWWTHDYTREELAEVVFVGETSQERKIWLQLMGDTMREFAKELRKRVDVVNPDVRLGHCSCLSTWDLDGIDSIELARIFAGNTKPFMRLVGAPYWNMLRAYRVTNLGTVADLERMEFAWCAPYADEIEFFAEGDVYPRPRYRVPSSYLEGLHQVLCAEGNGDKMLKYMIDYVQDPSYEQGYINRHIYYEPLRGAITKAFSGKKPAGIYVHEVMHKLENADCNGMSEADLFMQFTPMSLNFAEACSLPISFEQNEFTKVALIFGENAKYTDDNLLNMPLVLDAYAASILTQRGIDVGLDHTEEMQSPTKEVYLETKESIPLETGGTFRKLELKENATVLSTFENGEPAAYVYENAQGIRYLVYAFESEKIQALSTYWMSYPRQRQLFDALRWMEPSALPIEIVKEPGVYILCRKSEGSMAVGIWNFGQDLGMPGSIVCDEVYQSIECINDVKVALVGNEVRMDSVIPPFGFAGFVLKK